MEIIGISCAVVMGVIFLILATTWLIEMNRKRRVRKLAEKLFAAQQVYSSPELQQDAARNAIASAEVFYNQFETKFEKR